MSYPIGAEALSQGLHSVPQLREIALHFYTEHTGLTQGKIREFALPRIARWLEERAELDAKGNDILAFFYEGDLVERRLTNMYPARIASTKR